LRIVSLSKVVYASQPVKLSNITRKLQSLGELMRGLLCFRVSERDARSVDVRQKMTIAIAVCRNGLQLRPIEVIGGGFRNALDFRPGEGCLVALNIATVQRSATP
jgi:hypothetical protein